jgi:hypothetical protein
MQTSFKQNLAKQLAGIELPDSAASEIEAMVDSYFARVFTAGDPG